MSDARLRSKAHPGNQVTSWLRWFSRLCFVVDDDPSKKDLFNLNHRSAAPSLPSVSFASCDSWWEPSWQNSRLDTQMWPAPLPPLQSKSTFSKYVQALASALFCRIFVDLRRVSFSWTMAPVNWSLTLCQRLSVVAFWWAPEIRDLSHHSSAEKALKALKGKTNMFLNMKKIIFPPSDCYEDPDLCIAYSLSLRMRLTGVDSSLTTWQLNFSSSPHNFLILLMVREMIPTCLVLHHYLLPDQKIVSPKPVFVQLLFNYSLLWTMICQTVQPAISSKNPIWISRPKSS